MRTFKMKTHPNGPVNRSVLVVRPAEPFVRWAVGISGGSVKQMQKELAQDNGAYLIPAMEGIEIEPAVLELAYPQIFERELEMFHEDEARWPKKRSLAMFKQWFELELLGMTIDLCDEPLWRSEE